MAKARRKKKPEPICIVGPTDEQIAAGVFRRANTAYRRVPVIDTLHDTGKLTYAEYAALSFYRDQAIQAEDDTARIIAAVLRGEPLPREPLTFQ